MNRGGNEIRATHGAPAGRLSPSDVLRRQEFDEQSLERKSMDMFILRTISKCFKGCVNDFSEPRLTDEEKRCQNICIMKANKTNAEANDLEAEIEKRFFS